MMIQPTSLCLIASILILGMGLLRLLGVTRAVGTLTQLAWSWLAGAFGAGLITLAWCFLQLVGHGVWPLILLFVVLGSAAFGLGSRRSPPLLVPQARAAPGWERALFALAVGVTLLLLGGEIMGVATTPIVSGDEANFWALKAKMLYAAGGFNSHYQALAALPTHRINLDYPPFNPLLQLLVFEQAGTIVNGANRLPIVLFGPATVLALAGAVARWSRPLVSACLVLAVFSSDVIQSFAGSAMSDLAVALAVLCALEAGLLAGTDPRWTRLLALFGASAVFAKHDSKLFLVAASGAALAVFLYERWSRRASKQESPKPLALLSTPGFRRTLLCLLSPLAVVLIVDRLNSAVGALNNFDGGGADGTSLLDRLVNQVPSNLASVLRFFGRELIGSPGFALAIPIAFFALVVLAPRVAFGRLLRIPTGAFLLAWIGLVLIFCSLPHRLEWHLATAGRRVPFQMIPALALWLAVAGAQLAPSWFRSSAPSPEKPCSSGPKRSEAVHFVRQRKRFFSSADRAPEKNSRISRREWGCGSTQFR